MKAIILAAGQGTRLRPLTDTRPKCLVELGGRALLDYQLVVLRAAGIDDITVVAGYLADSINRPGVHKLVNPQYDVTNMVSTLFCAEKLMTGTEDLIISYGDIVYESRVLEALLGCDAPMSLAIDRQWHRYWAERMDNPLLDAETLKMDGNRIVEVGKKPQNEDEIQGQYIGLIKVRADYVTALPQVWRSMDHTAKYDGKDYDNMYLTSFIQHLIDIGWEVIAAPVDNGWLEVDSVTDLDVYNRLIKSGRISKYCRLLLIAGRLV